MFMFRAPPPASDLPDTVFARHGESSAAVRPPGSREIRLTHGEKDIFINTDFKNVLSALQSKEIFWYLRQVFSSFNI